MPPREHSPHTPSHEDMRMVNAYKELLASPDPVVLEQFGEEVERFDKSKLRMHAIGGIDNPRAIQYSINGFPHVYTMGELELLGKGDINKGVAGVKNAYIKDTEFFERGVGIRRFDDLLKKLQDNHRSSEKE